MAAADARAAAVEARWLARSRRRALGMLVLLAVVVALVEPFRTAALDWTPLWLRHDLIAAYTRLLPEPTGLGDLEPIADVDGNPYGVNVFLEQEVEEEKVRRSMEMISAAGFGWVKQQLVWNEIEQPRKGQFVDQATGGSSWGQSDRIVDFAHRYGLRVIFRIDTSPAWARPGVGKIETPPADVNDYADFVAAVAARYRGRVSHYQIWNEPNLPFEWGDEAPDAAAYTRLLRLASERIHARDPDAVVISAALAPTTEFSEKGINDLVYLQQMYDAGVRGGFDVLGANAYGLRSGPDDLRAALDRDVNFSRPILVRRVMVRNGDANRPIWAAEVGWNAVPEGSGIADLWGRVDRQTQADYTVRAYARAIRDWPWMGVLNLWHFRMAGPNARKLPQYYFNAVDEDFTPEPLYVAMTELMHRPRAMQRGYRQESDWTIEYRGDWTIGRNVNAVLGRYQQSRGDASFRIPFDGTDLDLVVDPMPGGGTLVVSVDGGPPRLLDASSGAEEWAARARVVAGLPDGRHVLDARVVDGRPVRLDGVIVDRRESWPGLGPDGLVFAVGMMAIGAAVAARLRPTA